MLPTGGNDDGITLNRTRMLEATALEMAEAWVVVAML